DRCRSTGRATGATRTLQRASSAPFPLSFRATCSTSKPTFGFSSRLPKRATRNVPRYAAGKSLPRKTIPEGDECGSKVYNGLPAEPRASGPTLGMGSVKVSPLGASGVCLYGFLDQFE